MAICNLGIHHFEFNQKSDKFEKNQLLCKNGNYLDFIGESLIMNKYISDIEIEVKIKV